MKTLQAGDKAVLDGKEIVQDLIPLKRPRNSYKVYRNDHGWFSKVHQSRLQPAYIVRVLQDGRAREVNPLGEENEELASLHEHGFDNKDYAQWHEAESQCLTLPWTMQSGITQKSHSDDMDKPWYAILSSDKFTLIKPVTDDK